MDKYIEETINGYDLKGKPCCFLTEKGACEIVSIQPLLKASTNSAIILSK